ncbi:Hypothetical protein P9211_06391 [Prochlorococcus marinus str. MIT 9211]|uniref:Uncharacterized protein n=1 Tax=Prochlorococcus marinus (strain MIT 9211) TaxID=93059 RepID=A9B9Q8_PROM4|nr:Hypothetical protein P9211_06391 [Prochlorococcus marinus str. MIT 9211]
MAVATKTIKKSLPRLGKFATSKLIQNLGSNQEQYKFDGNLRTVHGRD